MVRMQLDKLKKHADEIIARYEQKRAAMLPILRLVQDHAGFITTDAEQWVGKLLDVAPVHVHEVVTFYTLFRQKPVGKYNVQVCANISCALNGSEACVEKISKKLGIQPGETTPDKQYTLQTVECLCACEAAPAMQVNDIYVGPVDDAVIETLLHEPEKLTEMKLAFQGAPGLVEPIITKRFSIKDSQRIDTYMRDHGYEMARKALTEMKPEDVIAEVSKANLRGLGGAGFPTGKKWSFIPKETDKPKYLVVNADEGEPGTIKDRYIISEDPHRLIEGMLIAAYATGCRKGYIYIRGEYVKPTQVLEDAVYEARENKLLGKNIFDTDFSFDIVIHRGAGAYICGEESALLESLEGKKGFPRLRPPFPAISGLFACPTVINNVETLAFVPTILARGGGWFAKMGTERSGGTRLFSLSGHVEKPGLYEAAQGIALRELIDAAGGVLGGKALKAVIPGGISAKILRADEIDVKMDFDSLLAAGSMAGSAGVIIMDETTSMVKALWYACKFFAHESCGQCSPCREGTGWIFKIIDRIVKGRGRSEDLDVLLKTAGAMEGKTICVFADAAAWPVQSYITKFRKEFETAIREGKPISHLTDTSQKSYAEQESAV